jgi:hypothetical protein
VLLTFVANMLISFLFVSHHRLAYSMNFHPNTGMDMISLEGKTNFFEKRVGEYRKSGVMSSLEERPKNKSFNFDADF